MAEVQTEHVLNTSQERCHYARPIGTFRLCLTALSRKYLGDVSLGSSEESHLYPALIAPNARKGQYFKLKTEYN
jgi:hypothetical protein